MEPIKKAIENEAQYNWAMKRIDELLPKVADDTPDDNPSSIELYRLSQLVQQYDDQHYPIAESSDSTHEPNEITKAALEEAKAGLTSGPVDTTSLESMLRSIGL